VSCTTTKGCLAVGYYAKSPGVLIPLAMTRPSTGGAWTVHNPLVPPGSNPSGLDAVKCVSSPKPECIAVGSYTTSKGEFTFSELWNWSTWRFEKTIQPAFSREAELNAVSCTSSSSCMAVGDYLWTKTKNAQLLSEQWKGSSWTIRAVPVPAGATTAKLWGVSCRSALACTAVGDYATSLSGQPLLSETWKGSAWSIHRPPNPAGSKGSALLSASCLSTTSCVAVGDYLTAGYSLATVGESRKGRSWTIHPTPNKRGKRSLSILAAVVCLKSTFCISVGTLSARWNGASWTAKPLPHPSGTLSISEALGISCLSHKSCTAAGYYGTSTSTLSLMENWNGTAWSVQTIPQV
jgi:hypothetical protein